MFRFRAVGILKGSVLFPDKSHLLFNHGGGVFASIIGFFVMFGYG